MSADNWDTDAVFLQGQVLDRRGVARSERRRIHPRAELLRRRQHEVLRCRAASACVPRTSATSRHHGGMSPPWPLSYQDLEPWYADAEQLYHVHGKTGEDPTEGPRSAAYPYPAVEHEPRIQQLHDDLERLGLHPSHLPIGVMLDQDEQRRRRPHQPVHPLRPRRRLPVPRRRQGRRPDRLRRPGPGSAPDNLDLVHHAKVERLETDDAGRQVTAVVATLADGSESAILRRRRRGRLCGALNSALLLLRSANDAHPNGLANGSDQVGRNYMRHNNLALMALSKEPNPTQLPEDAGAQRLVPEGRRLGLPVGRHPDARQVRRRAASGQGAPPGQWGAQLIARGVTREVAHHGVDFWLSAEDLPHPDNRLTIDDDGTRAPRARRREQHRGPEATAQEVPIDAQRPRDARAAHIERNVYLHEGWTSPPPPTRREPRVFGTDPTSSVLDLDCKAHELDNLYVVDSSFFVSIGAVNPTLTIIANALRVGEHLDGAPVVSPAIRRRPRPGGADDGDGLPVVVVGGGFAGVACAKQLGHDARGDTVGGQERLPPVPADALPAGHRPGGGHRHRLPVARHLRTTARASMSRPPRSPRWTPASAASRRPTA